MEEPAAQPSVVVTGASTGIGKAIALVLAGHGYRVYAGVRREEDGARLVAEAAASIGAGAEVEAGADAGAAASASSAVPASSAARGAVVALMLDVTEAEQVDAAVEAVRSRDGGHRLAGLVNNAGIAVAGPMEFLPIDDLRSQFEVNVLGQVAVTQAFLPLLRESGGRLVFVGSVSGLVSSRLLGAYASSKFALEAIADAFRRELAPWKLRVSVVEPGRIATPIWEKSVAEGHERLAHLPPEAVAYYDDVMQAIADGAREVARVGTKPEAVAYAVLRALTARRPRTRYFVGTDAHIINVMRRVVSDPLLDRIIESSRR
jgi:NAD(P)-dependent dehydrogenase (short-subunit alcohol dehydrogenase family)